MKKLVLFGAAALMCSCATDPNAYVIKGQNSQNTQLVLLNSKQQPIDTIVVKNGKYEYKGQIENPEQVFLMNANQTEEHFQKAFFLEAGTIRIEEKDQNSVVSGTPSNDAAAAFETHFKELNEQFAQVKNDEEAEILQENFLKYVEKTVQENRTNLFGLTLFAQIQMGTLPADLILEEIGQFSEQIQANDLAVSIKEYAQKMKATEVGQPYIDIKGNDPKQQSISLKEVVETAGNKYVLLDFWASWCNPCMNEVPHLVKTYKAFHKKGFEIYGVSLDRKAESWTKTIQEKKMNWIHISQLNGDREATEAYSVMQIPTNFLIDCQTGTIISSGLMGDALYAKIEELLGK